MDPADPVDPAPCLNCMSGRLGEERRGRELNPYVGGCASLASGPEPG